MLKGILDRLVARKPSKTDVADVYHTALGQRQVRELGDARLMTFEKDGAFDYALYRELQNLTNARKLESQWVTEPQIAALAQVVARHVPQPRFGLCHGTRQGKEQKWFAAHLPGCDVLGTEIADSATQFPQTVQWDFHDENPDWLGRAAFVYSNSWDHAYDPKKAFTTWVGSLKPGGVMLLDCSSGHMPDTISETDPFGAGRDTLCQLLTEWFGDIGAIRETQTLERKSQIVETVVFQRAA